MRTAFTYDCTPHFVHFAYRFTGKERDSESGNDYFGARYYSSTMGRFMSPDWDSDPTAVPYAEFTNPQSLNLYGYVLNNPLSHRDSDGHSCDPQTSFTDGSGAMHVVAGQCHFDWFGLASVFGRAWQNYQNINNTVLAQRHPQLQIGIAYPTGGLGPVLKGLEGVRMATAEIEAEGGTVVAREVTIENSAGKARVDLAYRDSSGELKFGEAKNGPTADLNTNQKAVYGAMEKEGANLVGGNANSAGLPSSVPPQEVRVFKY
ncbi:MAG: RHS repeat-associated core domain-containing protein [Silvibacterium sp.]